MPQLSPEELTKRAGKFGTLVISGTSPPRKDRDDGGSKRRNYSVGRKRRLEPRYTEAEWHEWESRKPCKAAPAPPWSGTRASGYGRNASTDGQRGQKRPVAQTVAQPRATDDSVLEAIELEHRDKNLTHPVAKQLITWFKFGQTISKQ